MPQKAAETGFVGRATIPNLCLGDKGTGAGRGRGGRGGHTLRTAMGLIIVRGNKAKEHPSRTEPVSWETDGDLFYKL